MEGLVYSSNFFKFKISAKLVWTKTQEQVSPMGNLFPVGLDPGGSYKVTYFLNM